MHSKIKRKVCVVEHLKLICQQAGCISSELTEWIKNTFRPPLEGFFWRRKNNTAVWFASGMHFRMVWFLVVAQMSTFPQTLATLCTYIQLSLPSMNWEVPCHRTLNNWTCICKRVFFKSCHLCSSSGSGFSFLTLTCSNVNWNDKSSWSLSSLSIMCSFCSDTSRSVNNSNLDKINNYILIYNLCETQWKRNIAIMLSLYVICRVD